MLEATNMRDRVGSDGGFPTGVRADVSLLLLLLTLCAAALLRIGTANYSLWYDELASLEFARQPFSRLWSGWMVRETNPPLFYSMLSGTIALFGHGDIAVRGLPIAVGLAGIGATYLLGKAIAGPRVGLLACMLLSLSAQHVDLSQQVRAYSLAHCAVAFSCLGMTIFLQRRSTGALCLYVVATLVALYAHTTMAVFAALAGAAMAWLLRADRNALLRWLAANVVVLAGWGWWAIISLRQIMQPTTNIDWIAAPSPADAIGMTATAYLPLYDHAPGMIGTLMLVGLCLGIGLLVRHARRPEVTLLALLVLGAPVVLFAISQRVPIFLPRTLSWASGPELVLVAFGVTSISSTVIARTIGVLLVGLSVAGLSAWLPDRERDQWRQSVRALERIRPAYVIVGDDAVALAIGKYSRPGPDLIVPIVVRSSHRERWAAGLYAGPHISSRAAARLIRTATCSAIVGWGPFRPVVSVPEMSGMSRTFGRSPSVTIVRPAGASGPCRGPHVGARAAINRSLQ